MPDSNSLTDCCNHACYEGTDCPRRVPMQLHRIDPLELARRQGFLRTADGGHEVSNEISVRVPAPAEAATKQSDAAGRLLLILAGVLAALLVAASAFDLRFPT